MARAKAKAAYVRKERKRLAAEQEAAAEVAPTPRPTEAAPAAETEAPAEAPPPRSSPTCTSKATGEIDQETYDALIAEGKSERMARAKAKAAWVKKRKQEMHRRGRGGA
jgi:hypothetical protein